MNAPKRWRLDPNAMVENGNSIWNVYDNVSDVKDDKLIEDWNDSLNSLLVFVRTFYWRLIALLLFTAWATIFAAALAALIVESMQLLEDDPQAVTTAILLHISNQLASNTTPPFVSDNFVVPQYAIITNALLFFSLGRSLVAALAAVLALQWVNEYDARINTVDARKDGVIRHFQRQGIETWKSSLSYHCYYMHLSSYFHSDYPVIESASYYGVLSMRRRCLDRHGILFRHRPPGHFLR
jgi:hypothetical protein